jgi:hypothetical protein
MRAQRLNKGREGRRANAGEPCVLRGNTLARVGAEYVSDFHVRVLRLKGQGAGRCTELADAQEPRRRCGTPYDLFRTGVAAPRTARVSFGKSATRRRKKKSAYRGTPP